MILFVSVSLMCDDDDGDVLIGDDGVVDGDVGFGEEEFFVLNVWVCVCGVCVGECVGIVDGVLRYCCVMM